jgi:putative ABC transport system permease protein
MLGAYRVLLRAFPTETRDRCGDDMTAQFREQHAALAGRPLARAALWIAATGDALWHGSLERLGAPTSVTETHRSLPMSALRFMMPGNPLRGLGNDLRVASRRLLAARGFTLVALLTLALGIGATTAIFSVVYGVLLKPLPFPRADRLVGMYQIWEGKRDVYSPPNFLDVESRVTTLESAGAYTEDGVTLTNAGDPIRLTVVGVTGHLFATLGVAPQLGRALTTTDNQPGHTDVVVISHTLWQSRFGADPAIIGRAITLDGKQTTVVGVMPAGFTTFSTAELWTPLEYTENFRVTSRGAWYLDAVARLKPGVTLEQAQAEVATIGKALERQYPKMNEKVGMAVHPLLDAIVGDSRSALLVLLASVGLVLLIACVNVANLLLVRAASREGELAVRVALGAGRARLMRELLTESLLLAVLGGAVGVALAIAGTDALVRFSPPDIPRIAGIAIDGHVAGFAIAATFLTGLLFGLVPALQVSRGAVADALRERGRSAMAGPRGRRLRSTLVIAELALAVLLLVGAGLLIRSFSNLVHVDPGFNTANALTFSLGLPGASYKDDVSRAAFHERMVQELAALPGVTRVGEVLSVPPTAGMSFNITFAVTGRPPLTPGQQPTLEIRVADAAYFDTMGIAIRRGRGFTAADRAGTPQVLLLTESAVRRHFPTEDPLGKHITMGWRRDGHIVEGDVVGVVADVKSFGLDREAPPQIYFPLAQVPTETMAFVVRTAVPPAALFSAIRAAVARVDPKLPVNKLETLEAHVDRTLAERRFYMLLLVLFAGVALALAAIGIFGVLSYLVSQRTREIGIRVALGAGRAAVLSMVVRQAAVLATIGASVGLAGAIGLSRYLRAMLFELSPTDAVTFVVVGPALVLVALLAAWVPARRAVRVDPIVALRND